MVATVKAWLRPDILVFLPNRRNRPPFASKWFFPQTTFVGFGSSSKTHTVDYCFVSGSYAQIHDSSTVTIVQTYFEAPPSYFCNIFLHQSSVFERWSNFAGSNENKSFLRPAIHAILNVCCWTTCPRMPLSYGISHDNIALSVHARHQCSLAQWLFLEELHGIRLWACYDGLDWIH